MKHKILFISPSSPFPPRDGKRQRTLALLLGILPHFDVDFLILSTDENLDNQTFEVIEGVNYFFFTPRKKNKFLKLLGAVYIPDSVNSYKLRDFLKDKSYYKIFCRYPHTAKDLPSGTSYLLDVDDDFLEWMKTRIREEKKLLNKLRLIQIFVLNLIYYQRILNRANQLIWVKLKEIAQEGRFLPNLPFQLLLKGKCDLHPPIKDNLLFIGKLSYSPNAEGIQWFLERVWPALKKILPYLELTIISSADPSLNLNKLIKSSSGVKLVINFENLEEAYKEHKLCIVPIFFGGGSNIKVSEALLMGRFVISSPFGLRGFESYEKNKLVHVAKHPEQWINKIVDLLKKPWEELMFSEVKREFSIEKWNQKLKNILSET